MMSSKMGARGLGVRAALALFTTCAMPVLPVHAQGPAAKPDAPTLAIPSGPLAAALVTFGRQTGIQVSYVPSVARGLKTAGVSGALAPDVALGRLLAGSGLSYRFTGARTVLIEAAGSNAAAPAPEGTIALDTIVVDGARSSREDEPYRTPGSPAYISREQIQRVPPTNLGDMFRETPGVLSAGNRSGSGIDLNIRGLQGANRIATMVDGTQQMGSQYIGYRGSTTSVFVDPDFIAGIDIIKGPSDGPYGAGAIGGVVNMRTLEAKDILKPGASVGGRMIGGLGSNTVAPDIGSSTMRTGAGKFGESFNGSVVGAVAIDNYELLAGFSQRKSGNYFAGTNGSTTYLQPVLNRPPTVTPLSSIEPGHEVFNTSEDSTSLLLKGKVKSDNGQTLELGFTGYQNIHGEVNDLNLIWNTPFDPLRQLPLSKTTTYTYKAAYTYKPDDNALVDFHANVWMTDFLTHYGVTNTSNSQGKYDIPVTTIGSEVWNRSKFATPVGQFQVDYGTQLIHEKAKGPDMGGITYPGDPKVYFLGGGPAGTRLQQSLFTRSTWTVTDWLAFGGGLRYDHFEIDGKYFPLSGRPAADMSAARYNPTASVTLTPFQGFQLFTQYSQGWRPPNLRETTYTQSAYVAFLGPNPNLRPELAENVEYGANLLREGIFKSGDQLKFKLAYFDNHYNDYIVRTRGNVAGFTYSWGNIDQALFRGVEASFGYDARVAFLQGSFNYYTKIQYCDKQVCNENGISTDYGANYVPPRYTGSLTAGVRLFDETLTFGTRVTFASERASMAPSSFIGITTWPQSTIVDLFGSYKIDDTFTVNVSATNLLDRYYLDPLTIMSVPSPGRTIKANLTATF